MAVLTIPLRPDLSHYALQIFLDGTNYSLEFRWGARDGAWRMDVLTDEGEPIYTGIKVTVHFALGKRCRDERFPPGAFIAVDTAGTNADPGEADLGDRVQLYYYEADDLPVDLSVELEGKV